eukprot:CAMPEP_0184495782 /NCGR_PEP_ID=MMETSP0113_2-20130426/32358_1 /TAXON_ID=91329 /ORGANISM="Norrisiella sphaerica, Strain BC52" /LENGTH=1193 /DNA_ID=CAMNT_0026882135 /DNA_START=108 /DNA_END=3689 /DNA_ORIENTATION=-
MFNKFKRAWKKKNQQTAAPESKAAPGYTLNDADIAHPVKIFIDGGNIHTSLLKAGGTPDNKTGTFRWYRSVGRQFNCLKDVIGDSFRPTLDDVGSRISTQWIPDDDRMVPSAFGEAGPLELDPEVAARVEKLLELSKATFVVNLGNPSSEPPSGSNSVTNSATNAKPPPPEGLPPGDSSTATVAVDISLNSLGPELAEVSQRATLKLTKGRLILINATGSVVHSFPLDKGLDIFLPNWGPAVMILRYDASKLPPAEEEEKGEKKGADSNSDLQQKNVSKDADEEAPVSKVKTQKADGTPEGKEEDGGSGGGTEGDEKRTTKSAEEAAKGTEKDEETGKEANGGAVENNLVRAKEAGSETDEKVGEAGEANRPGEEQRGDESAGEQQREASSDVRQDEEEAKRERLVEESEGTSLNDTGTEDAANGDRDNNDTKFDAEKKEDEEEEAMPEPPSSPVLLIISDFITRDVVTLMARRRAGQQDFQPKEVDIFRSPEKGAKGPRYQPAETLGNSDPKPSVPKEEQQENGVATGPKKSADLKISVESVGEAADELKRGDDNSVADSNRSATGNSIDDEDIGKAEEVPRLDLPGIKEEELRRVIVRDSPFGMRVSADLVVEDVGGPAQDAGIVSGDILFYVGGKKAEPEKWITHFKNTALPFELILKKNPNAPAPGEVGTSDVFGNAEEISDSEPTTPTGEGGGGGEGKEAVSGVRLAPSPHRVTGSPLSTKSELHQPPRSHGNRGGSSSMEKFLHRQLEETEQRHSQHSAKLNAALQTTTSRLNQFIKANKSYEVENKGLKEELSKVRNDLEEALPRAQKAAKIALQEDMDTLKEQIRQLSKELAEMSRHEKSLELQVATVENSEASYKAKLQDVEGKYDDYKTWSQQEVEKLGERLKEVNLELKEAQRAILKKEDEITDLENHCAHLKAAKDRLEVESEQTEQKANSRRASAEHSLALIDELKEKLAKNGAEVESLKMRVSEAEAAASGAEERLKESEEVALEKLRRTEAKLNKQLTSLTTQRNRYKRKAESLSSTVRNLLREKTTSANSVAQLYEQKLASMKKEKKAAMQALETYKRAFEQHLMGNKPGKRKVFMASSARADQELMTLRKLANGLSETISDKDEVIVHMRKANKMLGTRIQELEKQLKIYEEMAHADDHRSEASLTIDDSKSMKSLLGDAATPRAIPTPQAPTPNS